jgi:hypothetical protein
VTIFYAATLLKSDHVTFLQITLRSLAIIISQKGINASAVISSKTFLQMVPQRSEGRLDKRQFKDVIRHVVNSAMGCVNLRQLIERIVQVSDRFLSDQFLSDQFLSDQFLSDQFLSDRFLSDQFLSDRFLSDQFISDRFLSDRFLSDQFLSDWFLSDQFRFEIYLCTDKT